MAKEAVFKFVLDGKQGLTTLGSLKGKIIETEQSLKKFKSAINKQGGATAKQAAATAKLEARLRGLRGSYREATNAASGLTKAGLRFRDKMGGAFMSQLKKIGGAIAATFAVRAVVNFGKASVEAFDKQEKAQASLLTALKGREDIQQRLIHQAQQLQQTTLFGDEETIKAQSLLAQLGATEDEIVKLTPLVQDFATAQGMDLAGAANLVAKSIGSSTNALQRYGITIEGAVGSQDRLDSAVGNLSKAFEGQAAAAAQAGTGGLKQLSNAWGDLAEVIGGKLIADTGQFTGALQRMTENITGFLDKPFSDELKLQKIQFDSLIPKLTDANQSEAERLATIKEAQKISPDFLKGLSDEELLQADITTAIQAQNEALQKKIDLQVVQEKINSLEKDITQSTQAIAERKLAIQKEQVQLENEAKGVQGEQLSSAQEFGLVMLDINNSWTEFLGFTQTAQDMNKALNVVEEKRVKTAEKLLQKTKEENAALLQSEKNRKLTTGIIQGQLDMAKKAAEEKAKINKKAASEAAKEKAKEKEKAKADEKKLQDELALIKIQAIQNDKEREIALLNFKRDQKIKEIELSTATEETKSALILEIKKKALQDQFDVISEFAAVQTEKDNQAQADAEQKREDDIGKTKEENDKKIAEEERVRQAKITIAKSLASSLGAIDSITKSLGIKNAALSKTLGLAQIAVDTGVSLSNVIAASTEASLHTGAAAPVTLPLFIAQGTAVVLGGIASAIAELKKAPDVSAAGGADFVTSKPTLLMVGDNPGGQERVTVQPLSGSGQTHYSPDSGVIHMAGGGTLTTRPQLGSDTFAQIQAVEAIRAIQNPVVGVEEIRDAMNNVEVTENRITI